MAANEFEKNVQKTLDRFTLRPSQEVWRKVEGRVRQKERKRRVIFFIIFSLLGLALAGYGVYNFSARQKITSELRNRKPDEKTPDTANNAQKISNIAKTGTNNGTVKAITIPQLKVNRNAVNGKPAQKNNDVRIRESKDLSVSTFPEKRKKDEEKTGGADIIHQPAIQKLSSNDHEPDITETEDKPVIPEGMNQDTAKTNVNDTFLTENKKSKNDDSFVAGKKSDKNNQASEKIKWGLNLTLGSSTITGSRFSLKNRATADMNSGPGSVTGSPGGLNAGSRIPESPNRHSFAIKAGLSARKILSNRSALSISLDYAYLADKIDIGTRQNGNLQGSASYDISSYYRGTPQESFTDAFHFLELPIIYDWRVTSNTNRFISLEAGTSVACLISSNALVYDTISGGIYYHNKDLFNKVHANFISGLSYHFILRKNFEMSIGPRFSFDIRNIFKTNLDARKYFLYTGIGATIIFENPKK